MPVVRSASYSRIVLVTIAPQTTAMHLHCTELIEKNYRKIDDRPNSQLAAIADVVVIVPRPDGRRLKFNNSIELPRETYAYRIFNRVH